MTLQKLEEVDSKTIVYAPTVKERNNDGFVDLFTTALLIILSVGVVAAFFVTFDIDLALSVKTMTINSLWFALSTFAIGALSKRLFRRKGRKTKEYVDAKDEAIREIKALNDAGYAKRATDYSEVRTQETINRYRTYELTAVGLTVEDFERDYLGKGIKTLWRDFRAGKLSSLQCRAISRCNHAKIKAYDPNFITSFYATIAVKKTASSAIDVERADFMNDMKSAILALFSAVGIGVMFSDVILNFSAQALFLAIVKIVTIGINIGMKASYGWDLSVMEMNRNKLRASEARACVEWCKNATEKQI